MLNGDGDDIKEKGGGRDAWLLLLGIYALPCQAPAALLIANHNKTDWYLSAVHSSSEQHSPASSCALSSPLCVTCAGIFLVQCCWSKIDTQSDSWSGLAQSSPACPLAVQNQELRETGPQMGLPTLEPTVDTGPPARLDPVRPG